MNRQRAIELLTREIGAQRLIWLGTGGDDALRLASLPQLSHAYSLHSPCEAPGIESFAVESLTGRRQIDYDIALFLGEQGRPMIESFERAVSEPSVLVSYAPYAFLDYVLSGSEVRYLGNSHATFTTVSDKPRVEAALSAAGLRTIPWVRLPVNGRRPETLREALSNGPIVLRSSKQDGGNGHELIDNDETLEASRIAGLPEAISVAPLIDAHVPVCIGGCVFPDGGVTVHTPSFQLIGIRACSPRDFGYCGNDFGAVKRLTTASLQDMEKCVRTAGAWLHSQGFIGAFGVDALVREGEVVFVEINPRFQGSSRLSAELDEAMDQPDVYLDHLMACLGMPSYESMPLAEQAMAQPGFSQVHCQNLHPGPVSLKPHGMELPKGYGATLLPKPGIRVGPGSLLFTLQIAGSVTCDGGSISREAAAAVEAGVRSFAPCQ